MKVQRCVVILLGARLLAACVDTTPFVLHENDAGGVPEAGVLERCRDCMVADGGPCWAYYGPCLGIPKCTEVMECAFGLGCFDFPNVEDRISCGTPCFVKFAIGSTDPAIGPLIQLNACSQTGCQQACAPE